MLNSTSSPSAAPTSNVTSSTSGPSADPGSGITPTDSTTSQSAVTSTAMNSSVSSLSVTPTSSPISSSMHPSTSPSSTSHLITVPSSLSSSISVSVPSRSPSPTSSPEVTFTPAPSSYPTLPMASSASLGGVRHSVSSPRNNFGVANSSPLSIQSTWITIYSATPTTEIFSTMTTVDGSGFETTMVLTTSYGGYTSTETGYVPVSTNGSSGSNASTTKTNRVGGIVGAVLGAVVVGFLVTFMCRVFRRRHSMQTQERQMTDSWLKCPFSGMNIRHPYNDMDGVPSTPLALSSSTKKPLRIVVEPLSNSIPGISTPSSVSPLSPIFFANPFGTVRPKPVVSKLDMASISGPIGPVSVEGDGDALRSAISITEAQDQAWNPFLDVSSNTITPQLHVPGPSDAETRELPSRASTNATTGTVAFARPISTNSLEWYGDEDPFVDQPMSLHRTLSNNASQYPSRYSIDTSSQTHTTYQSFSSSGRDSDGHADSFRGPNLTALIKQSRGQ